MTTIASDGKTIAADGLILSGEERLSRTAKKIRVVNGTIYALSGVEACFDAAIQWHQAGCEGLPPRIGDGDGERRWVLLVARPDGLHRFRSEHDRQFPDVFPYPAAFGSGGDYALGAMYAGASPQEAVGIAARICTTTGGSITVVDMESGVEVSAVDPVSPGQRPKLAVAT